MKNAIIVDLDGPVLSGKNRHYQCYADILNNFDCKPVPVEQYWQLKRNGTASKDILVHSDAGDIHDQFLEQWDQRIEQPDMLALDRLQPKVMETLARFKSTNQQVVLATQRRSRADLIEQLQNFGLIDYFDHIVVCESGDESGFNLDELRQCLGDISPDQCLWIGDTEADFNAARAFGCDVWLISEGHRENEFLESLQPDFLSRHIHDYSLEQLDL